MRRLLQPLVFSVLLATSVVSATVLVPAEFSEVVSGSEMIVHGRVLDVRPTWADGRRRIDSLVTLEVMSWVKGGQERTVTFTVAGGEIGRYRQVVVGAPVFRPGDEAFLFLKTQGSPTPYVFGLNQGVFRVTVDGRGQRQVATPALLGASASPEVVKRGSLARRPVAIETFRTQLRTAMAAERRPAR